jgi:MFS transporter, putative metabolite:H+ symporter
MTVDDKFVLDDKSSGFLIARLDRVPTWSLPFLFVGVIGVGLLFTFYDIFDINVSFIQTCRQIVLNCTAHSALNYIGLPVLLNLVGYVIGTFVLSPLADRDGRRDPLLVTMVITGLRSVLTGSTQQLHLVRHCVSRNLARGREAECLKRSRRSRP